MQDSNETVVEQPLLFYPARSSAAEPAAPGQKGRFHAMAKPIGSTRNIDCTYCYYLHKEHLLDQHRGRRMEPSMLERYIRQYVEAQNGNEVIFSWQGGEPTMLGIEFFRDIVDIQNRCTTRGRRILNDLQTNGTLLDDDWCRFLKENDFLVGISIDGPRELHSVWTARASRPSTRRCVGSVCSESMTSNSTRSLW
ncbi:radical SAM protein [Paraburkholderia hospita]|uniref:radical SAM protein n=1 Tax=Paraburkholderia hospita TaxID=169430 RepID=UPI001F605787|nr:radical SAM protein [Paraburkholderia hospita]